MSKTVKITYSPGYRDAPPVTVAVDVCRLAAFAIDPFADWSSTPLAWLHAQLTDGVWGLSPRGEDLVASIDSLPDDPTPQPVKQRATCSRCNGTGKQPLFVSMITCDACKGSGFVCGVSFQSLRETVDEVLTTAPNPDSWFAITSRASAESFIGKRVIVHAPAVHYAGVSTPEHPLHNKTASVVLATDDCVMLDCLGRNDVICWETRRNVHFGLLTDTDPT